ncbi:MAG: oligosaccharide flippase family protein [Candidatus Andersenbacteria bacterium]|nr:oligosaccharide flippase family protein [Candidatus Andersenbacteria bacterium]MBI3250279.1 oligosaccharide flippase family protein [Candidatus Andersenbacteria bacterium]
MPKQSRITGAMALLIAQAVVLMLGYVTHLWIGRFLGPGPYGIYGVVLSLQTILGILLTLGVPSAVSRFVAQDEVHAESILRQALKIQTLLAFGLSAIVAIFSPGIAFLLNDPTLTPLIAFVAAVLFLQAFYPIYVQYFSGLHRFNRQALLTIIYAIAKLAGAVALLYAFDVFGAFSGFAIGGVIAAMLGWYWTRATRNKKTTAKLPLKEFLSFAGMYVLILAGLQLLMSIDLFMVKSLLRDDVQAGYYNAAVTLSRISYFLLQGLSFIVLPSVSKLTKPGASQTQAVSFISRMLRYLIALIIPSITLAAATSEQLVILFFSSSFVPGAPALTVLMLGVGILSFYLLLANIAAGANKAKTALGITILMIIVSLIAGFILIPRYQLVGAAWQTTIAAFVGLIALTIYIFSTFRIPYPVKSTINIVIATAAAVLPTYVWEVSPFLLPLQYVVLLGLYIVVLWILGEVKPSDRALLASIHPRLSFLKK